MHIGSAMTENVLEADPKYVEVAEEYEYEYVEVAEEYEEEVLVIGVLEAFTNFSLFSSRPMQAPLHNSYFSALIMFVCALSFDLRIRIYTI
jgi:fluoride ion exporter CrcB/FEX